MSQIKYRKQSRNNYPVSINEDFGYYPRFQDEISHRVKKQLAVNVVVTGEAGISKSYTAITMCRVLNKKFSIDDVVSTYAEYMKILLKENRAGVPIIFDEPQYSLDHRDWYNQVNKALIKTITSQRFRLRPLFIPIINQNLLDKVLRSYLIQFQVIMRDRGEGDVYRLSPSQMEDKLYRTKICSIEYGLFEPEDNCPDEFCLSCKKLGECVAFRAQYELKKASWMKDRDEAQLEEAEAKENKITNEEISINLYENKEKITNPRTKRIDHKLIIPYCKEHLNLIIGIHKAETLRDGLYYSHPELRNPV